MAVSAFSAADQQVPDKRPTKIWNRTGPLGDTPKHVTDAFPLVRPGEQGRLDEIRANERRVRGRWARSRQVESGHSPVERTTTGSLQRQECHRIGRQAAPDDAEGEGAREVREARLQGLHSRRPAHEGEDRLRLLRDQGQADELGGIKFVLVQARCHARLGHRDRCVRDRRQGQGLRAQVQHEPPRVPDAQRKRSTGASAASGSPRGDWPTITTSTAWSGRQRRSSISWMAWLCEQSKTRTGTNRSASSSTARRCPIGSGCPRTRTCLRRSASSMCGLGRSGRSPVPTCISIQDEGVKP